MFDDYHPLQLFAAHGIGFHKTNLETEELPVAGEFDLIVFTEVIEHLQFHPVPTLRKLAERLAPGGRLFLSTPDAEGWGGQGGWGRLTHYPSLDAIPEWVPGRAPRADLILEHIWQYSLEELLEVVHRAGLRLVRLEYAPGRKGRHFNMELSRAPSRNRRMIKNAAFG